MRSAGFRAAALRLAFAAFAGAAALSLAACDDEVSASSPAAQQAPPKVGVSVMRAEAVRVTTELPGRTVAYRKAEVRPQVDGVIRKRLFEEGAAVEAGQPLYQIDPATYEAEVKAAEADLARARAALTGTNAKVKRYESLVQRRNVSRQDYDDAVAAQAEDRAEVRAAEAALEKAKIDLGHAVVTAPISGVVGRSWVSEGALVTANQEAALSTITQLDPIYADLTESSNDLARMRRAVARGEVDVTDEGAVTVRLSVDGIGAYAEAGRVKFSEVLVDEGTGTVNLRAVFPNPNGELLPGMFVRATVGQGMVPNAFRVPQAAVQRGPDGAAYVWRIAAGDKVERRDIVVERAIGTDWLVTEGVSDGDRIVVDGLQRVRPDMQVTPVDVAVERAGGGASGAGSGAAAG